MRMLVLAGLVMLGGCGGGGTSGTNYSDPPPMAEIVATPSPKASPTPVAVEAESNVVDAAADASDANAAGDAAEAASNVM
jgi:hypothetical protein